LFTKKAVFLDRDGVINHKLCEGRYVTRWANFVFLPRAAQSISALNEAGFQVIVVTNQRCVAKGLVTVAQLEAIHRRMCRELAAAGATVRDVYYCPHEELGCQCRKPAPGMLLTAATKHQIDLASSWMIGDSEADVQAGNAAGCRTIRILERHGLFHDFTELSAESLPEAVQQLLDATREETAAPLEIR
jgi:D-glycero-D-manno-heptose 1,7-bisphosphate phosphatase